MADQGVGSWIERRARLTPRATAIVHGDSSLTYAGLSHRVRKIAQSLRGLGVDRGDRVAWLGHNHPAFLELLFATAKLGAVLTPINHRLSAEATTSILEDSAPTVVVTEQSVAHIPLPASARAKVVVGSGNGQLEYEKLVADSSEELIDEIVELSDPCMLPYTSGTTGAPKGVTLTHGNVTWNVLNFLTSADFQSGDITIAIAPFFRVGGTGVNVLPVIFKGGTVVVPQSSQPDAILQLIESCRVTVGFGNPDLLETLARSPLWSSTDLSSIRFFMTGGAPVPETLIRTYLERGITFLQGYGLSEAAPLVLLLDPESANRKAGSAGRPPLLVDVRIARPDGSECQKDETGELLVRGPNVMAGYWKRPDATRRALKDGWLHTGDAAYADDEGYVWIVDRVEDGYFSASHVVYPGNIERTLSQHPAVAEAGAVGLQVGEGAVGIAFIVLAEGESVTEEEMLAFCRSHLQEREVPARIKFIDVLPRNPVGKLLRGELRALANDQMLR